MLLKEVQRIEENLAHIPPAAYACGEHGVVQVAAWGEETFDGVFAGKAAQTVKLRIAARGRGGFCLPEKEPACCIERIVQRHVYTSKVL